ncbi:MAG: acetyl-CoA C-acyltransferase [Flavobacteriales bacterium]
MMNKKNIVFIDGCRTPFLKSGTDYLNLMSYELGQFAIKGLLQKTDLNPKEVDQVIMGTVISNVQTSNVAREAALSAGIPNTTHCQTVTQACISANRAICNGVNEILVGNADVIIAGGVENTSDTPIGFPKKMRNKLFGAQKLRGLGGALKFIFSLRFSDFIPVRPAVAEYMTGRTMGQDCDIMAARFNVSREEQDDFAYRSHQLAVKAQEAGYLKDEMCEVALIPKFKAITSDNGIRSSAKRAKLAKLRAAFDKKHGTLTAANSSFLTDGGAASLIMSEAKAVELSLKPKSSIIAYTFTGQDLEDELLLGPAYAIAKVLEKANLTLDQMDVIELHEAFAGQVLANIKCLASDEFAKNKLGRTKAVGELDPSKLNKWGGSLSIGHPFGATGSRLLTTASNRLIKEGGTYALIAACAAGAHGHAMIIKKYNT